MRQRWGRVMPDDILFEPLAFRSQFAQGMDRAPRPCTYCNKCLVNVIENPLGCYDETRFGSREEMISQILSVYQPAPFAEAATHA